VGAPQVTITGFADEIARDSAEQALSIEPHLAADDADHGGILIRLG
jgi:hypothetical protein